MGSGLFAFPGDAVNRWEAAEITCRDVATSTMLSRHPA